MADWLVENNNPDIILNERFLDVNVLPTKI
jgi:hypothetical protein